MSASKTSKTTKAARKAITKRAKSVRFTPTAQQLSKIKKLRKEGLSLSAICERIGLKTEHPWNKLHRHVAA